MRRLVLIAALATLACGKSTPSPTGPGPVVVSPPTSQALLPEIRGVVRQVDGGPVAGATVVVFVSGPGFFPEVTTDAGGAFAFPSRSVSGPVRIYSYRGDWGDEFVWNAGPTIAPSANPSPVSLVVKFQPALKLAPGQSIDAPLTDDASSFDFYSASNAPLSCALCAAIVLKPTATGAFDIRVQASAATPLHLWLVGADDYYDADVLLGEATNQPGTSDAHIQLTRPMLDQSRYHSVLYVERPIGSPAVSLHVTMGSSQ